MIVLKKNFLKKTFSIVSFATKTSRIVTFSTKIKQVQRKIKIFRDLLRKLNVKETELVFIFGNKCRNLKGFEKSSSEKQQKFIETLRDIHNEFFNPI